MQALPAKPQPFCGVRDIALAQIKDRNDGLALNGFRRGADQLLKGEAFVVDIDSARTRDAPAFRKALPENQSDFDPAP